MKCKKTIAVIFSLVSAAIMSISVVAAVNYAEAGGATATSTYAYAYSSFSDSTYVHAEATIHNNAGQNKNDSESGVNSATASVTDSGFTSAAVHSAATAEKNSITIATDIWNG